MQDQPVEICRDSIPGACISLRFFILFLRSIFHLFQKSIHESVLYLFVGQHRPVFLICIRAFPIFLSYRMVRSSSTSSDSCAGENVLPSIIESPIRPINKSFFLMCIFFPLFFFTINLINGGRPPVPPPLTPLCRGTAESDTEAERFLQSQPRRPAPACPKAWSCTYPFPVQVCPPAQSSPESDYAH